MMRPRVRRLLAYAVAPALALAGACGEPAPQWREVAVPGAGPIVTLTRTDTGLLIGRYDRAAAVRGSISHQDAHGRITAVALEPKPGYGQEAEFVSMSTRGGEVVALGSAHGGAHGNFRWTVWRGDLRTVTELPQTFETFGGWEAGAVAGSAYGPAGPMLAGSWLSPSGLGFDVAVWRPEGDRWVRTGEPAARVTSTELPAVTGVAAGDYYLAVGSATVLGRTPHTEPRAWRAERPEGPWRALPLQGPAQGAATAVACTGQRCMIAGHTGDAVVAWQVEGAAASAPTAVTVAEKVPPQASVHAAIGPAGAWIAVDDTVTPLTGRGRRGPVSRLGGAVTAIDVGPDGRPAVATVDSTGAGHLWQPGRLG